MKLQKNYTNKFLFSSKFQRVFSFTFIFCLLSQSVYPSLSVKNFNTLSAAQPLASAALDMVDLYTGDFHYSVPLMTVPGPNGESVNIAANYTGGVRMNQKASWLGLGWDYNPGEITRQVVGYPDDYNGIPIYNSKNRFETHPSTSFAFRKNFAFGSLYFNNYNNTNLFYGQFPLISAAVDSANGLIVTGAEKSLDLYTSEAFQNPNNVAQYSTGPISINQYVPPKFFTYHTAPYSLPAYDKYMVSGPGIGGKITPLILQTNLTLKNKANVTVSGLPTPSLKTQFHFENSTNKSLSAPDDGTRIKSGYFTKYYTNDEINNSSNLFSNSTHTGFLDYRTYDEGPRRPLANHPASGIGAIEITDPNGVTYHYSLPVYNSKEIHKTFFNHAYPGEKNLRPSVVGGLISGIKFEMAIRKEKYAESWKLTSVTGPDYQDSNENKMVDEGDQGYWISYAYKQYAPVFVGTDNYFNYNQNYNPKINLMNTCRTYAGYKNPAYEKVFNNFIGEKEIYYLDKIKTATHTAYFIKNFRNDNISYDRVLHENNTAANVNAKKSMPDLKLERIILMRNEDGILLENQTSNLTPQSFNSKFNNNGTNLNSCMSIGKYNSNKVVIDQKSLRSVVFKTDYSLCRKYYNNITNDFVYANFTFPTGYFYGTNNTAYHTLNHGSGFLLALYDRQSSRYSGPTNTSLSGKLTLNEIEVLEDGAIKVFPSFKFNYNANNSSDNPDYDPDKVDLWGYYKSDYTGQNCSNYTTASSAPYTDAWCLREIDLPTGSKIKIDYESDEYEREGFLNDPYLDYQMGLSPFNAALNDPSVIYPLDTTTLAFSQTNIQVGGTDYYFMYNDLASVVSGNSGSSNLKCTRIFIPMIDYCTPTWDTTKNPNNNYDFFVNYHAFISPAGSPTNFSQQINSNYTYSSPITNTAFTPSHVATTSNNNNTANMSWGFDEATYYGCAYNPSISTPRYYGKQWGYGFAIAKFKKLFGGGVRVKNIKITDASGIEAYEEKYAYSNGYCPNPSKPFCLGPQLRTSFSVLYLNYNAYFPYGASSRVGYSKVEVQNADLNGNYNGKSIFEFENKTTNNPLNANLSVNQSNKTACGAVSLSSCPPSIMPKQKYYLTNTVIDNKDLIMQGTLIKKTNKNNSNNAVSTTQYFYSINGAISEAYITPDFYRDKTIPFTTKCINSGDTVVLYCNDFEQYDYKSGASYCNLILNSIENTIDGITTKQNFEYDPHTKDIFKTTNVNNSEIIIIEKKYAWNNNSTYNGSAISTIYSGGPMGFKSGNESYTQQVLVPFSIRTIKTINNTPWSNSIFNQYIINENKLLTGVNLKDKISAGISNAIGGGYYLTTGTGNNAFYLPGSVGYDRLLNDITTPATTSPAFKLSSQITAVGKNGKVFETKTDNDKYTAAKYCNNFQHLLASIDNAKYGAFTFSSFENDYVFDVVSSTNYKLFDGDVNAPNLRSETVLIEGPYSNIIIKPHTGSYMAKVPVNATIAPNTSPTYVSDDYEINRTYCAKVWVHKNSPSTAKLFARLVNSSTQAIVTSWDVQRSNAGNVTVGDWVLMNLEFNIPSTTNISTTFLQVGLLNPSGSTDAYFDDFTFHPVDAVINGNVYDYRTGRLVASLDNENFATFLNYDAAGRPTSVYKETKTHGVKKISQTEYNNCQSMQNIFNTTNSPINQSN